MSAPFTGRRIPPVMGYYDYTRQLEYGRCPALANHHPVRMTRH